MRKKICRFTMLILVIGIVLSACGDRSQSDTGQEYHEKGLIISGGEKGKDWAYENSRILLIMGDQITIRGIAEADLKIECTDASQLTISDLKQGENQMYILAYEDFTLNLMGNSELASIKGLESMTIRGTEKDAQLLLHDHVSGEILNIDQANVTAARFSANKDINLTGASVITAKRMSGQTKEPSIARIWAMGKITINLKPGGSLQVEDTKDILALSAEENLILGENNKILMPQNGEIIKDFLEGAAIYDLQDEDATDVLIRNTAEEK